MKTTRQPWTEEELSTLEGMVFAQDEETEAENIETGWSIIYESGEYDFPERTLSAARTALYKYLKKKRDEKTESR